MTNIRLMLTLIALLGLSSAPAPVAAAPPVVHGPFLFAAACTVTRFNTLAGWPPPLDVTHPPTPGTDGPLHPSVEDPTLHSGGGFGGRRPGPPPVAPRVDSPAIRSGGGFAGGASVEEPLELPVFVYPLPVPPRPPAHRYSGRRAQ